MSIEEDIEYLQQFIGIKKEYKYKPIKTKTLINTRQAIENVLAELENSISKDKIREKIKEIDKAYEDSKDEYGESEYYYPDYTINILEELLESEG